MHRFSSLRSAPGRPPAAPWAAAAGTVAPLAARAAAPRTAGTAAPRAPRAAAPRAAGTAPPWAASTAACLRTAAPWAAALVASALLTPGPLTGQAAGVDVRTTALVGATVVDGTGAPPLPDAVVLVEGDRITCVGSAAECPVPGGAERVDLSGRWITPGLIDAHVHFSQTGWVDGRPDGISAPEIYPYAETSRDLRQNPERWFRSYLCSGITAVYDVGGHPWTTGLHERAEHDPGAPHVRAAGPLVTWVSNEALNVDEEHYTFLPMGTAAEVEESVEELVGMEADAVKVWYLRPRPERREELDHLLMEAGRMARERGLDLIVHATSLREAKVALRAGAVLLVHSVEDQPVDDEFLALLAANDAVYAPTLVVGRNWTRAYASAALGLPYEPDDPGRCVDPATRAKLADVEALGPYVPERLRSSRTIYRRLESAGAEVPLMYENLRRVHGSGATVVVATDAGNPLTLHGPSIHQEMEAMQEAGLEPMEIIVAATRNGAVALGRSDDLGTLEAGNVADLIVLEEDPTRDVRAFRSLSRVMRAGVLRDRAALAWPDGN